MTYPYADLETNKANETKTRDDHPAHHNALAEALNDVKAELGSNPKGGDGNVEQRFDRVEALITALDAALNDLEDEVDGIDLTGLGVTPVSIATGAVDLSLVDSTGASGTFVVGVGVVVPDAPDYSASVTPGGPGLYEPNGSGGWTFVRAVEPAELLYAVSITDGVDGADLETAVICVGLSSSSVQMLGSGVSSHGALTDLDADDHRQYQPVAASYAADENVTLVDTDGIVAVAALTSDLTVTVPAVASSTPGRQIRLSVVVAAGRQVTVQADPADDWFNNVDSAFPVVFTNRFGPSADPVTSNVTLICQPSVPALGLPANWTIGWFQWADDVQVFSDVFSGNLSDADGTVQRALETIDGLELTTGPGDITLDTTNFDGLLSVADDDVQKAFDTLDDALAGLASTVTYVWSGSEYVLANSRTATLDGATRIFVGPTDPATVLTMNAGDQWKDTSG